MKLALARKVLIASVVGTAAGLFMAPLAYGSHMVGHGAPAAADKLFAADFIVPKDQELGFDLGGFGGITKGQGLAFNPVIFVHGNAYDANFWDSAVEDGVTTINVRKYFRAAGYTDQEIWGISYNGKGCSDTAACGTANDINVADLYPFIQAVRSYTGSGKVDIVAHSLGVTVVRKTIKNHPDLLGQIEDAVFVAGANHGTSACRNLAGTWYGCDEVVPGSAWLDDLNTWDPNGERDETPGPIRYMTIYDGSGASDNFFVGQDAQSPSLTGADNRQMPGTAHLPLARGKAALDTYLPFLRDNNVVQRIDGGKIVDPSTRVDVRGRHAGRIASTGSFDAGAGAVLLIAAALTGLLARPRRKIGTLIADLAQPSP
ncbi:MAG: hypothetical protein ABR507_11305 [Actinomycetota bacterium]|nr:hypothetical protein [Actinomycetota bacterium]